MKDEYLSLVYTHSIDGVIFYIGFSQYKYQNRAFLFKNRSKDWKEYVKGRTPTVDVIYFEDPTDARNKEKELIKLHHKTLVNKCFNPLYTYPITLRHKKNRDERI